MICSTQSQRISEILRNDLRVQSVSHILINNNFIENIAFEMTNLGAMSIDRLKKEDASALYDFYFHGLSDQSRRFFGNPYPIFTQPLLSPMDIKTRIKEWEKEDDWTVLKLLIDKSLAGIIILKRLKTDRPVTGIAIRENYHRMGLGLLMQTINNEQARLLNIKTLWSGAAQENFASISLHEKCGFRQTGKLVPHYIVIKGVKTIERYDVDMVKEF